MDIAIRWQVAGGLIQQIGLSEGRRHLVVAAVREPVILFATQPAVLQITENIFTEPERLFIFGCCFFVFSSSSFYFQFHSFNICHVF